VVKRLNQKEKYMSNADIRGQFVWHELMTTDTKAASAFYPKVTGWRTQPWDKDPSYTLWLSAKGPFGGVRTLPDAARAQGPAWLAYIGTPDVDATLQNAQRLGARVSMGATDLPETGRMAVLADPQGAAFALFSAASGSQAGSGSGGGAPDFSWHELTTSDVAGALRFYAELFGWQELAKHDMGPMGTYHLVGPAGAPQPSIGMYQSPADKPMPTRWLCYVHVTDVDKAANAAKGNGGKVTNGPMEVPGGTWIAHCTDPQGAAFAVHADKRIAAPAPQPAKPATAAAAPPKAPPPKPAASQPPKPASPPPPPKPAAAPAAAKPAAPSAPKSAAPPTLNPPSNTSAPTVKPAAKPVAPSPAARATPAAAKPSATAPAPAKKAVKKAVKKAAKKAAKKAVKKAAPKAAKKKASPKKAAGKKRTARKSKAAKQARRASVKRRPAKKRGKSARRSGGLATARRVAMKRARSLLRRLRGRKHR
jgi:predicted enzyme related to lactoylglutathione lyase